MEQTTAWASSEIFPGGATSTFCVSFSGCYQGCGARKNFRGFHSVAYDGHYYLMCLWRHNLTTYSYFQTNVLAKLFYTTCIFLYTHSPYFMCHCTEYKLSWLQVRISEVDKLNPTTQQFITAKISGCVLKQRSKTHSTLRQSNCNCKMRVR